MKPIQLLLCVLFFFSNGKLFSQTIKATPLTEMPEFIFAKIAWADEDGTCILSEKAMSKTTFTHSLFYYDKEGKRNKDNIRFNSAYSVQHEYCLQLNKTFCFFNIDKSHPGRLVFEGKLFTELTGIPQEKEVKVYNVQRESELKKLYSEKYKFNVIKGAAGRKALLTYNNDYDDPYREGFWFRTIDEQGVLSDVDTLYLPYSDRSCNISFAIYDDEKNRILLMCDLFTFPNKQRQFLKNSIVVYDINTHQYHETELTQEQFYKHKICGSIADGKLLLAGVKVPEEKGRSSVPYVFTELNSVDNTITRSCSGIIPEEQLAPFYDIYNYKADELFRPIQVETDARGNIHFLYSFYPMLDNVSGENGLDLFISAGFAFTGIGVYTSIPGSGSPDISSALIWLTFSPEKCETKIVVTNDPLTATTYSKHGFSGMVLNGEMHAVYNRSTERTFKYSQPFFVKADDGKMINDTSLTSWMKQHQINELYPLSVYRKGNSYYYLAHFSPANDLYGEGLKGNHEYYLLQIR